MTWHQNRCHGHQAVPGRPVLSGKNGKYYFISAPRIKAGSSCIGVAVAEHPAGPFLRHSISRFLDNGNDEEVRNFHGADVIDPSIYQEDGDTLGFVSGTETGHCEAAG